MTEEQREKRRAYDRERYWRDPEAAIARSRATYARNREALLARAKAKREANPEVYRERDKATYEKRREAKLAYNREWRLKNGEKIRDQRRRYAEANPDKVKKWSRDRYKRNPDPFKASAARRRARLRNAPVVEHVDRDLVYERDGGTCHICRRKVSRARFHLDHLVPLIDGGNHTYENVAVTHPRCNMRRGPGRIDAQLLLVG